jgi:hypothetical protein
MALAGDMLLAKKHKASWEIQVQMEQLLTAWQQLLQASNNYGSGLNEVHDILDFNNQAEKVLMENIAFNAIKHLGVI